MRFTGLHLMTVVAAAMWLWCGSAAAQSTPSLDDLAANADKWTRALQTRGQQQVAEATVHLDVIQQQIGDIARVSTDSAGRLHAAQLRMRVCYELARQARLENKTRDMTYRLGQVRSEAWRLRQGGGAAERAVGEFWLLQTDLVELERISPDFNASQTQVIDRLRQFVRTLGETARDADDPVLRDVRRDAEWMLLQLYDQRGMTARVCSLVKDIRGRIDADDPLMVELDRSYAYCDLVGRPANFEVTLADGRRWATGDQLGKLVVLYFWAGPGASHEPRDLQRALAHSQVSVLAIDLSLAGMTGLTLPALPWPVYREEPGQLSLTSMFAVRTVPRFAILDAEGKLQAVGGPAILDVFTAMIRKLEAATAGGAPVAE